MLVELTIRNFAIIDKLQLTFTNGFNVLTGETGAGKSIIIDAVSLLLGERATTDLVRAGAKSAVIEGLYRLSPDLQKQIIPILEREGLDENNNDTVLLGREIRANSRNFCRINGRSVNVNLLKEVAAPLVDIHGQHHHLSLLRPKMHQAFLDRFANLANLRQQVNIEYKKLQTIRQQLHTLRQNAHQIVRRIEQLTFQVQEIDQAALHPDEEDNLMIERNRLSNAEKINQLSSDAYRLLAEGAEEQSAVSDMMGQVVRHLTTLERIDDSVDPIRSLAEQITYQIEELIGQFQNYTEEIEFSPTRLQQVEERLGFIYSLKRKYGNNIADILSFCQKAKAELKSISNTEDQIEALQNEEEKLRRSLGKLAHQLSKKRCKAGEKLAKGVETELQTLGMAQTQFVVNLTQIPHPDGVYVDDKTFSCDETGIDQIEFLIAPNPGEPLKPMVKIASGGETSRLMLALKTVLALADQTPTLIFDEIDQGIGGRIGTIVGRKLWGLTNQTDHQVLCITHLPQIAAFGDTHYQVAKQIKNQRTQTQINALNNEHRIEELAQMLGTLSDTTRLSAQELMKEAEQFKKS